MQMFIIKLNSLFAWYSGESQKTLRRYEKVISIFFFNIHRRIYTIYIVKYKLYIYIYIATEENFLITNFRNNGSGVLHP